MHKIFNKKVFVFAFVFLAILEGYKYDAHAIQYCIDKGGGIIQCQDVSGYTTTVTAVTDISGQFSHGLCDFPKDFPVFRPGTNLVTIADATCEGQFLNKRDAFFCVGSTSPSVGDVRFSNCTEILKEISGDGQSGVMETILPEPLVVKVTDEAGNPKEGVTINWGITKVPDGAQGAVLGSPESATNQDGLAGAFLTLGDTEGDYQVTAICPGCTISSSHVVFTAKAKCAIAENAISPRSQCAPGVGDQQYDSINKTICRKGCALTALTMLLNFYGVETDVLKLNDWLKANDGFTEDPDAGNLVWRPTLAFPGSPFSEFELTDDISNLNMLNEELRQGFPVIVKIPGSGDTHFVVAFCRSGSTYKVWDPNGGAVQKISKDQIIGLRIFR